MCGEQIQKFYLRMWLGSPPHVRGIEACADVPLFPSGITPACAGNSFKFTFSPVLTWDHPRMCGE